MKAILLPHFAVQIVTASALATQSWSNSCALLIIPGGRDVPYVTSLAAATPAIRSYVENGGAFLGICAGAYFASRRVEWEMGSKLEVSGDRPLCFFDGVCKGSVYPGFVYESENGARAIAVEDVEGVEIVRGIYHNGGGEFVDVESSRAAEVFAKYVEGEGQGKIAAVRCRVGKGIAILWGAHPEYPLTQEPLLSALKKRESPLSDEGREVIEQQRWKLLRKTITTLGLHLPSDNQESNKSTASPLPQFLTSSISPLPTRILNLLAAHATSTEPQALQDSNDTFLLHPSPSATSILRQARDRVASETNMQLSKDILFYENGELPPAELTPKFSTRQYYSHLSSIRTSHGSSSPGPDKWGLGQLLLYGETVTSTQSMLDRNPVFLRTIPAPLLSVATQQLLGCGRGSHTWVSPAGCLQFSLLIRPKLPAVSASCLVFVQYLFGLAVVEACRELMGESGECIRLKWPNDIFALVDMRGEDGRVQNEKRKIGGILVSTNFCAGEVDVTIGCALNVLNPHPTTSLSQFTSRELTIEKSLATIIVIFERMWESFLENEGSFEPFMNLYLQRWLHSDQILTVSSVTPPVLVRIVGITADHGLLRTVPEEGGAFIDLQPDGNSLDMIANLIKKI